MRTPTRFLVSLAVLALVPAVVGAQSVVGGMAGAVVSRQIVDPGDDTDTRTGGMVGAFVDVQTPVGPLAVLAEAFYVQRGGRVDLEGPAGLQGEVRSDLIGFTVAPTLRVGIGSASLFAYGGPMIEIPVYTRSSAELETAYRTPTSGVFAVTGGGGLAVGTGDWSVRVEARIVEEISAAYTGDAGDFRHRSKEILVRVGRIRGR